MSKRTPRPVEANEPPRAKVLELASKAQVSVPTARKVLLVGVDSVRGTFIRERLVKALAEMGVT